MSLGPLGICITELSDGHHRQKRSRAIQANRTSGGAGRCQAGALALYHVAVFDWLLGEVPRKSEGLIEHRA